MPSNYDDNVVVKIGVECENKDSQQFNFKSGKKLRENIQELCNIWGLSNADNYALIYTDAKSSYFYVTEENKTLVKKGEFLQLVYSEEEVKKQLFESTNHNHEEVLESSRIFRQASSYATFAKEFIKKYGRESLHKLLIDYHNEDVRANVYKSLENFLNHDIKYCNTSYIGKLVYFVNEYQRMSRTNVLMSLNTLKKIVLNNDDQYDQHDLITSRVSIDNLFNVISSFSSINGSLSIAEKEEETIIQKAVFGFINALIQKSTPKAKKVFLEKIFCKRHCHCIKLNVLKINNNEKKFKIDGQLLLQLQFLQQSLLNLYEERMKVTYDPETTNKILELRRIAFDGVENMSESYVLKQESETQREHKKLGFKDDVNPAEDFNDSPPGMVALDNMSYFASHYSDNYLKLVLGNSREDSHDCPFGRASIELTKLLCNILKIGDPPTEDGLIFYPMLFTSEHAFEELYSICIVLLNKTWKVMNATVDEYSKVMDIVVEQITSTMSSLPSTLQVFKNNIHKLPHTAVVDKWCKDKTNKELENMKASPIVELRKQVEPEIIELIQQHRLNYLVDGSFFNKKAGRWRDKSWYCRLSSNHNFFHYGDCEEKTHPPPISSLTNKVSVASIKKIVIGENNLTVTKRGKTSQMFSFSLHLESNNVLENKTLDFSTQDEAAYNYWTDGIKFLLRQGMRSDYFFKDLKELLDMEVKLRLLEAEGISIPNKPPPIPPPPTNFNFAGNYD